MDPIWEAPQEAIQGALQPIVKGGGGAQRQGDEQDEAAGRQKVTGVAPPAEAAGEQVQRLVDQVEGERGLAQSDQ